MIVITADLGRLRAFRVVPNENHLENPNSILHEIEVDGIADPPKRMSDMVSDQAGRFRADGSPGHASGESHAWEQEQERRCLEELGEAISKIVASSGSEGWALAAPKPIHARLVALLDEDVRLRLGEALEVDLCKEPILKIQSHFKLPALP